MPHGRSSSTPRVQLVTPSSSSRHRERSEATIKPYVQSSNYHAEQSSIYPPDGYTLNSKRQRQKGNKYNRDYPAEYENDKAYGERLKMSSNSARDDYERERGRLRERESSTLIPSLWEDDRVTSRLGNGSNNTGVYGPSSHRRLRSPSDRYESRSYEYATNRESEYDKWPRISRTEESDSRHHAAQKYSYREHGSALDAYNTHHRSKYNTEERRPSY